MYDAWNNEGNLVRSVCIQDMDKLMVTTKRNKLITMLGVVIIMCGLLQMS